MGGYGSGERWRSKPKTDTALRLDVRWLARAGLSRPRLSGWMPLYWTCNGKPSGDIRVRYDARRPNELTLDYWTRDGRDGLDRCARSGPPGMDRLSLWR
jgi:hypothetical protein